MKKKKDNIFVTFNIGEREIKLTNNAIYVLVFLVALVLFFVGL